MSKDFARYKTYVRIKGKKTSTEYEIQVHKDNPRNQEKEIQNVSSTAKRYFEEDFHAEQEELEVEVREVKMTPRQFVEKFSKANVSDDQVFEQLINEGLNSLQMEDKVLAQEFCASLPTVDRWKTGESAPHSALRQGIKDWFLNYAKEEK